MASPSPTSPSLTSGSPTLPPLTLGQGVVTFALAWWLLLLPVKFGSSLHVSGVAFCPTSLLEIIFTPWPSFMAPVLAAIGLALVLLVSAPATLAAWWRRPLLWAPALALLVGALPGWLRTTETDVAWLFTWHTLGITLGACAFSLYAAQPWARRWLLLSALAAGTLLAAWKGWQQLLFDFEHTRQFVREEALRTGQMLSGAMENKLNENRVFADFVYPNSYAAHLLLSLPLTLAMVWHWARRIQPQRPSQIFLTLLAAALGIGALLLTRSRAAMLALYLTLGLALVLWWWLRQAPSPARRWLGLAALGLVGGLGLVGLFYLFTQRDRLLTVDARLHYWRGAWAMFLQAPFTGVGMGEFFPWYLRLKAEGAEETRLVHNLLLHYLSQAGIVGGLGGLIFLSQPLLWIWAWRRRGWQVLHPALGVAALIGATAWGVHALSDFNVQIAGSLLFLVALPALLLRAPSVETPVAEPGRRAGPAWPLWLLVVLGLVGLIRLPGEYRYQQFYTARNERAPIDQLEYLADQAMVKLPWSPYPAEQLGKEALARQRYALAERAMRTAVQRTPHRAAFHAYLAQALAYQGRFQEALPHAEEACRWYPHKAEYQQLLAALRATLAAPPPGTAP